MLLRGFVLAALMFVSSVSLGAPTSEEVVFTQRDGFVTLRGENNLWVLEGFKYAKDGWQDSAWREAYSTVEQAQKRIKQIGLNPSTAKTRSMILQQNGEHELRMLANPPLWKVTQSWSWAWEQKYADWINAEIDPQFFVKYQIPTDCADVAYALRWIFSRNNGLPAAVRLSGSGATFTQDSTRTEWMQYPTGGKWFEDKRFMKSLNWMTNNTYTHTLFYDSYPIAITQDALLAGSHHLALHGQSGHTQVIYRTFYNDPSQLPIRMMASTVPRGVRSLYSTEFWESNQPEEKSSGILRFRWAVKTSSGTSLLPAVSMPNYSKMQYEPEFMKDQGFFALAVLKSLNPSFTFESWLEKGLSDLNAQIESRRLVVEEGAKVCGTRGCAPGTADYENWSTPSRDKRIGELYVQLLSVKNRVGDSVDQVWNKAMASTAIQLAGVDYTMKQVMWTWEQNLFSSEPQMTVERRWGLEPVAFAQNLKSKLEENFAGREAKIKKQGGICSAANSCAIGSAEWDLWNSFESDALLTRLRIADADYCRVASAASCAGYSAARNLQTVTRGDRTAQLSQWLEESIWFNSDPRQPEAVRWGALKNKFRWKLVPFGKGLTIAKNGWSLDYDSADRLTNIDTGAVHMAPQGMKFTELTMDGARAYAKNGASTEYLVLDLSSFGEARIAIEPGESFDAYDAGIIISNRALKTARVYSYAHDMTRPIEFQNVEYVQYLSKENSYFVSYVSTQPNANHFVNRYAFIDAATFTLAPFELNLGVKVGFSYLAKSRTHVLGRIYREDGAKTTLAINLATGLVSEHPELDGFQLYLPDSGQVVLSTFNEQSREEFASIASVDESFKTLSKQTVGAWWNQIEVPLACAYSKTSTQGSKPCFRYDGKSIDVRNPVMSGRTIETWDDSYFGSTPSSGAMISLASWNNPNTVLASAPQMSSQGRGHFFSLSAPGRPYALFVKADEAQLGSIFTFGHVALPLRSESGIEYRYLAAGRGLTIYLPSSDAVWIDASSN